MTEHEAQDTFGSGLRAHLGRLGSENVEESEVAQAVAPASEGEAVVPPAAEEVARRARELAERERRFAEHVRGFDAHTAELARREERLREREAALEEASGSPEEHPPVRDVLRKHAELSLARIVQVFDDALTATQANGTPDFGVRLAAVRALLAEAYAGDADSTAATAAVVDELAAMRDRRIGDASPS